MRNAGREPLGEGGFREQRVIDTLVRFGNVEECRRCLLARGQSLSSDQVCLKGGQLGSDPRSPSKNQILKWPKPLADLGLTRRRPKPVNNRH
ncbi:MAG: hypothetical protein GY772_05605 [bacterium]|nr:hypothetical protein [bacterium]